MNEKPVHYWLNTFSKETTVRAYERYFKYFLEHVGKSAEEILEERKQDSASEDFVERMNYEHVALGFIKELEKRGLSNNSRIVALSCVRSFFETFGTPLNLKSLLRRMSLKPTPKPKHKFTLEELQRMYEIAGLRDKTLMVLAIQTGLAQHEIVRLKVEQLLPWLDQPTPTEPMILTREKKKTPIYLILGRDSVEILRKHIGNRKEGWLFQGYKREGSKKEKGHLWNGQVDRILKRLATKAGIKPRGTIRFHGLRMFFADELRASGMSDQHVDLLLGHSVANNGAYVSVDTIRERYAKAEERISVIKRLQPIKPEEIDAIVEKRVKERIQYLMSEKTDALENLLKRVEELEKKLAEKS